MALDPTKITVDNFDGLRLDLPPGTIGAGAAIDLLDVDWDVQGVLGSRMGAQKFTTKDPGENYDRIFGADVGVNFLGEEFAILARRGETLVMINEKGEETGGTLEVSTGRLNFVKMGSGAILTPLTYIANQNEPIRKFDGKEFSAPKAVVDGAAGKDMPRVHFVANWQDGANRLVAANSLLEGGPAGGPGSPSHVFFSEPGQPENWDSTAFVELNPGDGEQIIGVVSWGRQIFVFKETACYVFYGISADEEGKPIFNFQTVDLGTRAISPRAAGSPSVVAGREGVYFVAEDGVWVTTGGSPTLVTDGLDFSLTRRSGPSELGGLPFPSWFQCKGLVYVNGCLYVAMQEAEAEDTSTPVERLFKIDLATGRVTYWTAMLNSLMAFASTFGSVPRLFFSGAGANKGIYFYTPDKDEDPTVEMEPFYVSGGYDLEYVDEKTVTRVKIWGRGKVEVATARDYKAFRNPKAFQLGGEGVAQKQGQLGQTGTVLQHKISGKAPWSVNRFSRYVRELRVPATESK